VPIGGGGRAGLPGRQGEILEQHQVELTPSPPPSLDTNHKNNIAYDLIHRHIWTCILRTETGETYTEIIQINTNSFFWSNIK
jgi:hypothetical protein